MSVEHISRIDGKPPCVVCTGEMKIKEVRRHPDPAYDVCFLKCRRCGLERPMVIERRR